MTKSAKDIIKSARLPERTVSVCVRGDLVADIDALEADLKQALENRASNGRLAAGEKKRSEEIAAQIHAKQDEMAEHTLSLRVRALKPAVWREMVAKYPPAKDSGLVVDVVALMGEAIPASTVAPDLDADDWETLNESLPNGEMAKLIDAVWELNTQGVDVPKSLLASAITPRSSRD